MSTLLLGVLLAVPSLTLAWSPTSQQIPIRPLQHSQNYEFDPLQHMPGISPYFDAVGFGLSHSAPVGCNVTSASYLVRHAAIYANDDDYETYIAPFLWKLEKHRGGWTGPLEFLNRWHSPILEDRLESITPPGADDALGIGKHLLARYPDLAPTTQKILADHKSRTHDTAKAFVGAFPQASEIEVIRIEKNVTHGPSLIPHKVCPAFSKEPGSQEMAKFVSHYARIVSERLAAFSAFKLSDNDVVGLQQLCGYATGIEGKRSPICAMFTDDEWMAYEYAIDLKYAYMVGPLNPLSPYLGFPWLQTTTALFDGLDNDAATTTSTPPPNQAHSVTYPPDQRLFLSFTHREVPPFVVTFLGLFNSSSAFAAEEFPTDRINWVRAWKMSDLVPFLGHVGLEKLSCERSGARGDFVRVIANSAPRPIPACQSGPGASCQFSDFKALMERGREQFGDFDAACRKDEDE